MDKFQVLRNRNDWLENYVGQTYTDNLKDSILRGIREEHDRFKQEVNINAILNMIPKQYHKAIISKMPHIQFDLREQLSKKSLISCLEPETSEILSIGSSSLLKNEKTGKIIDNLILDNFGLWFAAIFQDPSAAAFNITLIDDAASSQAFRVEISAGLSFNTGSTGTKIKMGAGTTAPSRSDNKIQTALGASPESGYLPTNTGAYTISNTIIYQADANPTGGSGTVNEIGTFGSWANTSNAIKNIMLAHDAISPGVVYPSGKLLRGAYSWQI